MAFSEFRVLRVDLSRARATVEEVDEEDARLFLGGKSLGTLYVYRLVPPGTDPLSPHNVIIFSGGLFNALAPGASKISVVSKSPLTGLIHDSSVGDFFGPLMRKAGYNAIIVEGASRDPVYIYVENDRVEVRDASRLWGADAAATVKAVRSETREKASIAAIGPGGENLVRYASIILDGERAAGRGGIGAVMGSKKLKAVSVYGDRRPSTAHPEKLEEVGKKYYEYFATSPRYEDTRRYGTTNALLYSGEAGMSPSYNFKKPWIPEELAAKLAGEAVKEKEVEAPWYIHGASCPIKCARYTRATYKGLTFEVKPEYENLAMLGAATGVFDLDAVLYFNRLADDLGVDSISAGSTIAWFLELVGEGLVNPHEYGISAKGFGDAEAVEELLRRIAYRRGVGAILAEGVLRASQILGVGGDRTVHVKGLEAAAWDPRGRRGLAVSYATADVGASHMRGWPKTTDTPSKGPAKSVVESMAASRDYDALFDTLGLCRFVSYKGDAITEFYELITGEKSSLEELLMAPRRAEALSRIYGVLDHLHPPIHDDIPRRWMEPIGEGPLRGERAFLSEEDKREAIRQYYELRGWHPELGVPLPETLERLGLGWARGDALRALEVALRRAKHYPTLNPPY